jgi:hypothetical protein
VAGGAKVGVAVADISVGTGTEAVGVPGCMGTGEAGTSVLIGVEVISGGTVHATSPRLIKRIDTNLIILMTIIVIIII